MSEPLVPPTTAFQATFSTPVVGVGPNSFTVRGQQSGWAFRNTTYTGNGTTTISTPQGDFFPGEEVEIALTGLCPEPQVARFRVQAGPPSPATFAPGSDPAAGTGQRSVAICDLDGDGILDLAVANQGSNNVSVLLGNGDGTFQSQQTFPLGSGPVAVAMGDLNGDGILDIVAGNTGSANVSVLLGNGDGTFQGQQTFPAGTSPAFTLGIGDLNGDGILDLAVPNRNADNLSVLLGNGDGTFQPQQTLPTGTGSGPRAVAMGDLNGDAILDLAVMNGNSSSLGVLFGNGDGTFQSQLIHQFSAGGGLVFCDGRPERRQQS